MSKLLFSISGGVFSERLFSGKLFFLFGAFSDNMWKNFGSSTGKLSVTISKTAFYLSRGMFWVNKHCSKKFRFIIFAFMRFFFSPRRMFLKEFLGKQPALQKDFLWNFSHKNFYGFFYLQLMFLDLEQLVFDRSVKPVLCLLRGYV